ncbi:MAG: M48 family metalloprotease [Sedimentisphaerales bacterium]|nr:M48 family metalloprotease [Sedimentisphaerales bacterium]
MSYLNTILESELCGNLLLALLHSLWQGLIIAGMLLLYLKSRSAQNANTRYTASLLALSSILVCLLLTWSILNYEPAPTIHKNTVTNESSAQIEAVVTESQNNVPKTNHTEIHSISTGFNWKPPVIGLWLTGVLIMLFRAIYIIAGGARLQVQCDQLKDKRILEIVEKLRKNLRITRKIKVAVSEYVTVPGVIGFFSPLLLLPVSLITGVPDEALQAIFAHELAHIRRYDYLINFCQMVIEAILFFNPAVWWISRQIRIEREVCCDNAGIASIGRRIRYAEVLIQWAQKMKERDIDTVETAIAFGKQSDNSGMLERIKRIVSSDHRPSLKVSWHIATITLVLSIATLAALWQGTNITVAFAGKLLTPQERIDKITEISKEYGLEDREYGPEDNISISGIIKTWDGKPLPQDTRLNLLISQPHNSIYTTIPFSRQGQSLEQGIFNSSIQYGNIYITVQNWLYAHAVAGPFHTEPGGSIENIEIVLQDGFKAKIKIVDEKNNPVDEAKITGGYPIGGSMQGTIYQFTDSNGIATIEHASNRTASITIESEGFEIEKYREINFEPNNITTLVLKSSPATTGIVLSKETGKPIQGAKVRTMLSMTGNSTTNETGFAGEPDTISDENGMFTLSKLRSDRKYLIMIYAEGYSRQYLSDINAGDKNLKVELGPKKIIRGKITGELERLDMDRNGFLSVSYTQYYSYGYSSNSDLYKQARVTIKDDIGYFEIEECLGQKVEIHAANEIKHVDLDKDSLDDMLIELKPENKDKREVVLQFLTPENSPALEGGVRIDYCESEATRMIPEWLEITNSQARYEIPVPAKFHYNIDYYNGKRPVGYWFEGISEVIIPAGTEPYVLKIPVHPAGTIYGRVLDSSGKVIEDAHASLIVTKKPEFLGNRLQDINAALHGGGMDKGKFNASPIPLEAEYAIIAYSQNAFSVTKAMQLNQKNPIIEKDIQLVEGVTLNGQLIDIDGTPARDFVALNVSVKMGDGSWSTTLKEIRPDENGKFSIKNVNPDCPCQYSIKVSVRDGYRPVLKEITNVKEPVVIQLEKGLSAGGIVIDDKTGWPIPGVEVIALYVKDINGKVQYERLEAEGPTNDKGEFIFSNMSNLSYDIMLSGGANPANPFNKSTLTGGQKESLIIRAQIPEWSKLKPRKPD